MVKDPPIIIECMVEKERITDLPYLIERKTECQNTMLYGTVVVRGLSKSRNMPCLSRQNVLGTTN